MPVSARWNPWLVACVIFSLALVGVIGTVAIAIAEYQGRQPSTVLAMIVMAAVSSLGSLLGDPLQHTDDKKPGGPGSN